jgi:hypothetical protein
LFYIINYIISGGEILVYRDDAIPGFLDCYKCRCKFSAIPCPECGKVAHYKDEGKNYIYRCPQC